MSALPQTVEYTNIIEKKAGDLMLPLENFSTVSVNTCLKDAVYMLSQKGSSLLSCLLVFKNKTPVGMLRMQDLLELVEPQKLNYGWYRGWHLPEQWSEPVFFTGLFTRRCLEIIDKPVSRAMFPFTFYVQSKDNLCRVIHLMSKHGVDIVPVREENKVTGMIRIQEIFNEVNKIMSS